MPPEMTFIIDGAAMAELLRGASGPVMISLTERATKVQMAARSQLDATTRGVGALAASIVKRPGTMGDNPMVQVGSWTIPYALDVHDGTRPHEIFPKNKKALAFFWPGGGFLSGSGNGKGTIGKIVKTGKGNRTTNAVFAHVHHPGTAANPYLLDNLGLAVD